jgi:hypothetical protein
VLENVSIERSGKSVTISHDISLTGRQLNELRLGHQDCLTLNIKTAWNIEDLDHCRCGGQQEPSA